MNHPIAIAVAAASRTPRAAAVRSANTALLYFAFGLLCFALAAMVRDRRLPMALKPASWIIVGLIQLIAFLTFRHTHPDNPEPIALATFGITYLVLGTAFWLRLRSS